MKEAKMNIYYVLGINFSTSEVFTDLLLDQTEALNLAWKMASKLTENYPTEFNFTPTESTVIDHKLWIFAPGPTIYVAVESRNVLDSSNSKSNTFPLDNLEVLTQTSLQDILKLGKELANLHGLNVPPALPPLTKISPDDPFEDSLPGSFNYNLRGMTIKDIRNNPPDSAQLPTDLSEVQQYALVTARILKRPNFKYLNLDQAAALNEIKNKTSMGQEIVNYECNLLHDFIMSLESEESSSSSEEWSDD